MWLEAVMIGLDGNLNLNELCIDKDDAECMIIMLISSEWNNLETVDLQ